MKEDLRALDFSAQKPRFTMKPIVSSQSRPDTCQQRSSAPLLSELTLSAPSIQMTAFKVVLKEHKEQTGPTG